MKHLLILFVIALAGCQSAPTPTLLPVPAKPAVPDQPPPALPPAAPAPASAVLEQKIRQQAQYIEALISQNDALTAKLAAQTSAAPATSPLEPAATAVLDPSPPQLAPSISPAEPAPPPPSFALPAEPSVPPPPTPSLALPPEPTLSPNADNVLDLVAVVIGEKSGEPVNPFTVRTVPPEAMREVSLHLGGIVAGPNACAIINDRLIQEGDVIESLAVERIETNAVFLRHSGRLLRLPVAEKATRVRLPL